jgi:protein tyrosine phosphatase (PTP) superfamily phosphohydrolase (DUF442 family)
MLLDIYNYRQVTPLLASSGQPDDAALADIAAAGYEVILNLALHDDPRYSLEDEEGLVRALGMRYVHIPVEFDRPTVANLELFFEAMDQNKKSKLWVHCAANKRVSTFLGLYWHLREGVSLHEAFALQRQIWEPNGVWAQFIQQSVGNSEASYLPPVGSTTSKIADVEQAGREDAGEA